MARLEREVPPLYGLDGGGTLTTVNRQSSSCSSARRAALLLFTIGALLFVGMQSRVAQSLPSRSSQQLLTSISDPVKFPPPEERALDSASVAATPVAVVAPPPEPAPVTPEALLARAIALENEGRHKEAAKLLGQAVREGRGEAAGQAAKRLGDLLQKGAPGVSRDYGEALRYYEIARLNGVDVPGPRAR